ncbi:MAG TPA: RNA-binding protein, partial [Gemmatimonadetes bacterium]|nr:RNA-binding protein [Gemmatimonadota bacterium]
DGTWAQIAEMAGVDGSEWTWGSLFLDVDLDGFEDLLVANGHGRDMRDGDALERITGLRGSVTWNEAKSLYPELPTRNRAFRNRGDLTFEEVAEEWGFSRSPDVSHGIASGDL